MLMQKFNSFVAYLERGNVTCL